MNRIILVFFLLICCKPSFAWEFQATGQFSKSSPVICDLDKDGRDEIIIACTQNIYVFNYKGEVGKGWPKETWLSEFLQTSRSVTVGDIDNDGYSEIIAVSSKNPDVIKINVWDFKGENKLGWPKYIKGVIDSNYPPASVAVLADLNHDGKKEIIIPASLPISGGSLGIIYVFTDDGGFLKGWPQTVPPLNLNAVQLTSPAVGDIDKDGILEIVVAAVHGEIYIWKEDGKLMNGWPQSAQWQDIFFAGAVLGDLDNDGKLEISIGSINNNLKPHFYVWKYDGTFLNGWPKEVIGNIQAHAILGDINKDDKLEVIFPSNFPGGKIYCLSCYGDNLNGWPFIVDPDVAITNDAILVDIDADNELEVVITAPVRKNMKTEELMLFAIKKDGKLVKNYPVFIERDNAKSSSCAYADLDKDGKAELIFTGDNKIYVVNLNIKFSSLKGEWPVFRFNPEHNACFEKK